VAVKNTQKIKTGTATKQASKTQAADAVLMAWERYINSIANGRVTLPAPDRQKSTDPVA